MLDFNIYKSFGTLERLLENKNVFEFINLIKKEAENLDFLEKKVKEKEEEFKNNKSPDDILACFNLSVLWLSVGNVEKANKYFSILKIELESPF